MPKGNKGRANDYMTKEQSMRVVEELHNMRKDLNIWMPSLARTLGCSNYNITQMRHRVKHGGLVRGVFRYRVKKAKKDIAIIRPEFIKRTKRHDIFATGFRSDVFTQVYTDRFGWDAPYGRFGPRLEMLEQCEKLRLHLGMNKSKFSQALGYHSTRYYSLTEDMRLGMTPVNAFILSEKTKEVEDKYGVEYTGEQS